MLGFLLSQAASRRPTAIDAELPHFVDQLAIAIEAGMSFDAAVSSWRMRRRAAHGRAPPDPDGAANRRVQAGRDTWVRRRVGSEDAIAFADAVPSSYQLARRSRASSAPRRRTSVTAGDARRGARAEAPVKMLFPIAIFVLPSCFIVILSRRFSAAGLF